MPAKKILIVDDEPSFTQLIIEYFRSTGYEAFSAVTRGMLKSRITAFGR